MSESKPLRTARVGLFLPRFTQLFRRGRNLIARDIWLRRSDGCSIKQTFIEDLQMRIEVLKIKTIESQGLKEGLFVVFSENIMQNISGDVHAEKSVANPAAASRHVVNCTLVGLV